MKRRATLFNRDDRGFEAACRQWPGRRKVLVEGDSWFQYDFAFAMGGTNLYKEVINLHPMVSLAMSKNGDTALNMLSEKNLDRVKEKLTKHSFDYLFLSAGGNDIVNNLHQLSNQGALMEEIRDRYLRLCEIRDWVSPKTKIITHNYGYPNLERGAFKRLGGLVTVGPWIVPKLKAQGIEDLWVMDRIIVGLMDRFSKMLSTLDGKIFVADTASVVKKDHWRDEMHLTKEGFEVAAGAFFRN